MNQRKIIYIYQFGTPTGEGLTALPGSLNLTRGV